MGTSLGLLNKWTQISLNTSWPSQREQATLSFELNMDRIGGVTLRGPISLKIMHSSNLRQAQTARTLQCMGQVLDGTGEMKLREQTFRPLAVDYPQELDKI